MIQSPEQISTRNRKPVTVSITARNVHTQIKASVGEMAKKSPHASCQVKRPYFFTQFERLASRGREQPPARSLAHFLLNNLNDNYCTWPVARSTAGNRREFYNAYWENSKLFVTCFWQVGEKNKFLLLIHAERYLFEINKLPPKLSNNRFGIIKIQCALFQI